MTVRQKIELRMADLETKLTRGDHLRSAEGVADVLFRISEIAKFWSILTDGDRDYINAARMAVADQSHWN